MAALMFTDMVGYSALSSSNEKLAFELLEEHRLVLRAVFGRFGGVENKTIGDAFFVEFGSPIDAVQCAFEIQTALYERNLFAPQSRKLQIRIGIHLGDIIDSDGDSYGDPVNIAARVESLAEPGGICITQQVLDHVNRQLNHKFIQLKKIHLKNIGTPTQLYSVRMPWQNAKRSGFLRFVSRFASYAEIVSSLKKILDSKIAVLALWGAVLAVICFYAGAKVYEAGFQSHVFKSSENNRSPASDNHPSPKVDFSKSSWFYRAKDQADWRPFAINKNWLYTDEISGSYELKTEFKSPEAIEHPALVLGLIADTYRVYVNGHFVGGSGNYSSIEFFGVDPQYLSDQKSGEENTILIEAYTEKSLAPGLTVLPEVGAYLGEFDSVYSSVLRYRTNFHVMRSIYLAISLITACLSFLYFCFRPKLLRNLYFSIYLLLGSLLLAYYNVYFSSALAYPFHRFLKITALSLSSFVLCSAWLNACGKERLERANNFAGLCFLASSAAILVFTPMSGTLFLDRFNQFLCVALTYGLCWTAFATTRVLASSKRTYRTDSSWIEKFGTVVFGWASIILIFVSIKRGVIPSSMQSFFNGWIHVLPFVFALFVTVTAMFDFISKSQKIAYKRDRENLLVDILDVAEKSIDSQAGISDILKKLAAFVTAERATVYLTSSNDTGVQQLRAACFIGGADSRKYLKQTIALDEGIIGHVCKYATPILIEEFRNDARFGEYFQSRNSGESTYKTGSCMIFPLASSTRLYGVLTIADKVDGSPFSQDDFKLVHLVSKTLGLLVQSSKTYQAA